jgi:hypothetical protein
MGNCRDCKHYVSMHSECVQIVDAGDDVFGEPPVDKLAYAADVSDDSGLIIAVRVGPLFGCIHFTAK